MRFVHFECLKNWFASKRFCHQDHFIKTYFWQSLECELCKYPFQTDLLHNGKALRIIEFDSPTADTYIILESISNSVSKVIYIVDFSKETQLFIGRG